MHARTLSCYGVVWCDAQARMVESDIHVADLRKEALDFRREILLQSDLDSSQMHTAEKVLKFFDESIKKKV